MAGKARAKIRTLGAKTTWAGNPRGGLRGKAPSSVRQSKAAGITPGKPAYGILHGGNNSPEKLRSKAAKLFGTRGRNVPTGQARLESKARRQVY